MADPAPIPSGRDALTIWRIMRRLSCTLLETSTLALLCYQQLRFKHLAKAATSWNWNGRSCVGDRAIRGRDLPLGVWGGRSASADRRALRRQAKAPVSPCAGLQPAGRVASVSVIVAEEKPRANHCRLGVRESGGVYRGRNSLAWSCGTVLGEANLTLAHVVWRTLR